MESEIRAICQNCKSKKEKKCQLTGKFTARKATCKEFTPKGGK